MLRPRPYAILVTEQNNKAKINTDQRRRSVWRERRERESETQALRKHVGGLRGHRWTIGQLDKLWRSAQMEFAVASIIVA